MKLIALAVCLVGIGQSGLQAESMPAGMWTRRAIKDGRTVTMVIQTTGTGRTVTYNVALPGGKKRTLVVETQLDGRDAPVSVDGQPSNQTMSFRATDDRHVASVSKVDGQQLSSQVWEVSPDGKVIKVETLSRNPSRGTDSTMVDYWDKKE